MEKIQLLANKILNLKPDNIENYEHGVFCYETWILIAGPWTGGFKGSNTPLKIFKLKHKNTHCVVKILRNLLNINKF